MGKILTRTAVIILVASVAWLLAGCDVTGCLQNRNSIPLAGFYSASTGKAVSVSGVEIAGLGAPGDSVLYPSTQPVAQFYLPLRSSEDVTTYEFTFATGSGENIAVAVDAVTLEYTSYPWFASEDCGVMYRYHIDKVEYTTHVIERVEITDSLVTNLDIETIHIYLRDNSPQEGEEE